MLLVLLSFLVLDYWVKDPIFRFCHIQMSRALQYSNIWQAQSFLGQRNTFAREHKVLGGTQSFFWENAKFFRGKQHKNTCARKCKVSLGNAILLRENVKFFRGMQDLWENAKFLDGMQYHYEGMQRFWEYIYFCEKTQSFWRELNTFARKCKVYWGDAVLLRENANCFVGTHKNQNQILTV